MITRTLKGTKINFDFGVRDGRLKIVIYAKDNTNEAIKLVLTNEGKKFFNRVLTYEERKLKLQKINKNNG